MRALIRLFMLCTFMALGATPWLTARAEEPTKVVYHVTDTDGQGMLTLGNIRNHLRADPSAKIAVVTLYKGIDLLLEGTQDKNGNPYNIGIEELAGKGVEFKICQNSMNFFKVDKARVLPQAKIVPSGVAEIARLQSQEHYAYIKP